MGCLQDHSRVRKPSRSFGGAMLEFVVVLPLCLFVVFGAFELGRLLSQYIWVQQTSFNAAYLGSSHTANNPGNDPSYVMDTLYPLNNGAARNSMTANPSLSVTSDASNLAAGIAGRMNAWLPLMPLRLKVVTSSSKFIISYSPGEVNSFANDNVYYDCSGQPCAGPTCAPPEC
jgi:Flp pilus assembly protein TadG